MGAITKQDKKAVMEVFAAIQKKHGVARQELLDPASKDVIRTRLRQLAMYLLRKRFGMTFPAIAEEMRRDHSTVVHAVKIVEKNNRTAEAFRLLDA